MLLTPRCFLPEQVQEENCGDQLTCTWETAVKTEEDIFVLSNVAQFLLMLVKCCFSLTFCRFISVTQLHADVVIWYC